MKTTDKQVVKQLHEHILENFGADFGWDSDDKLSNLTEQIQYMRHPNENTYDAATRLVEGCTFLVHYHDVSDFLNSLGINPEGKEYSNEDSWTLYTHLLAREISNLV